MKIDGVTKHLGNRKYCLSCSPYKEHNTKKLELIVLENGENKKNCPKCSESKKLSEFYKRTDSNNLIATYSYCIKCWNKLSTKRQKDTKKWCLEYKGNKCKKCGYNKYPEALDFHHRERADKKFSISQMKSCSIEKLKKELDKCDLLCCRCHREVEIELNVGGARLVECNVANVEAAGSTPVTYSKM